MAARKNGLRAEDILANTVMATEALLVTGAARTTANGKSAPYVRAAARWMPK